MQNLTITLIQADMIWEQPEQNRNYFDRCFAALKNKQDLIILPEMFNTGFTMNVQRFAENTDGETMEWVRDRSAKLNSVIAGSMIIAENGEYYNRLIWMQPDGNFQYYDKRHLFRFGGEHEYFKPGSKKLLTELNGWKICPMVCYDLRFPVWAKNRYYQEKYEYDLLIYFANWPEARKIPWQILLKARAIENLSFVIGANRIGTDGRGTTHSGNSMVISPKGEVLHELRENKEEVVTFTLSISDLTDFREKFNVALDWDAFSLEI